MVAPVFILTRTFAISALFVGAFPITYAAPIPSEAASLSSVVLPRFCRQQGCLYALPGSNSDSPDATADPVATPPPLSTDASSSALQVIDLLISALKAAASSLRLSSAASKANVAVAATSAPIADAAADPAIDDGIAAVIGALADAVDAPAEDVPPSSLPELPVANADADNDASVPAVEVVGFSTMKSTEFDNPALV
ncbi:hypothetical protein BV20DRAFT_423997 [Pilatotrama ljubarskyi]|nr:hypothetical protein BV20DRAFT_423997 [Pilatotrama ljubarskyi]